MDTREPQLLYDKSRLGEIFRLRVAAWENSDRKHLINKTLFPNGWQDEMDYQNAFHFYCEYDGKIIAGARLNIYHSQHDFPLSSLFDKYQLPASYPFAYFSRLVVNAEHRKQNFATKLYNARQNFMSKEKVKFALVLSGNPKRIDFLIKNGWKVLGEVDVKFHPDNPKIENEYALIYTEPEEISIWGRSMEDYTKMFSLTEAEMKKRILGVADGPASFNYQMTKDGRSVVSFDPLYSSTKDAAEKKIIDSTNKLIDKLKNRRSLFTMQSEAETDELIERRVSAMKIFLEDFEKGKVEGRYISGALPQLPFQTGSFDLCLCSNLLFLFEEFFTKQTHLLSISEMLRVAKEVRIFPLYNRKGEESKYLHDTHIAFNDKYDLSIEQVHYEVYKDGNKMLVLRDRE